MRSSPPYLNNFDYADATRLELYFWGPVASWKEMCESVRSGMLVATTQQTRQAVARAAYEQLNRYPTLNKPLQPLVRLSKQSASAVRGAARRRPCGWALLRRARRRAEQPL